MPTVMGGSGLLCEAVPEAPAVSLADVGATSAPAWFGSVGFGGLGSNDPGRDVDAAMTMNLVEPARFRRATERGAAATIR